MRSRGTSPAGAADAHRNSPGARTPPLRRSFPIVWIALLASCLPLLGARTGPSEIHTIAAANQISPVPLEEYVNDGVGGRLWNAYNQTVTAAGPNVVGAPSPIVLGSTVHVYVQGSNGDLVEYVNDGHFGRPWNAYDLTAATGGSPLGGPPTALAFGPAGIEVYARAANGDLLEFANDNASGRIWNAYDLTNLAHGQPVVGGVEPIVQGLFAGIYAQGTNGHLIEYVNDGANGQTWNSYDLTTSAVGGSAINGKPAALSFTQAALHVYVRAASGDLVEYVNDRSGGGGWSAYDLRAIAGGQVLASTPSALFYSEVGVVHVYGQNTYGDLVEYVNDGAYGRLWNVYDLSVAAAGPFVAGTPAAVDFSEQGRIHIYVRGANNDLYEFVNDGAFGRNWNAYDLNGVSYGPSIGTDPGAVDFGGVVHVYAGGPTPMGGIVVSNLSNVPNSPYSAGGNVVALSFDDGPSPTYTPQVLQTLEQYRAPATFEITGSLGAQYPWLLQQMVQAGFGLANHTWDHVDLTTLPAARWPAEVDGTDNLVQSVTHRPVDCLRPPYGYTSSSVLARLAQRGLAEFMWDIDPSDYLLPGASVIAQRVLSALHPGAVIILHDGGGNRSQTVAALPSIINGIRAAGYSIVEACG
jgi:peptidoglycan/xylan/chitin deacetylase (PgdA/CDA1 family)